MLLGFELDLLVHVRMCIYTCTWDCDHTRADDQTSKNFAYLDASFLGLSFVEYFMFASEVLMF